MRTGIAADGANMASYSPVQQTVTFPAGLGSAQLRFWRYSVWGDGAANAPIGAAPAIADLPRTVAEMDRAAPALDDYFYAIAILPDGTIDWLMLERVNSTTWREGVMDLDVSRYGGKSIRFQFGTYNNGTGGISRTVVDDATITLCPPSGALVLPAGWADRVIGRADQATLFADVDGTLYRSADGGLTWALSGTARPEPMIMTAYPDVLYAGEGYPCYAGGDPVPMWRTLDAGASWREVAAGEDLKPLAAHPTDVNRLFAAGCDGPYLSTDGGGTWTLKSGEAFGVFDAKFIAPVGTDWQTVWVAGVSEGGGGAVLVSRDGGDSWANSTASTQPQIGWFGDLAVDRVQPDTIYAPAVDGFRITTDNGALWGNNSQGLADVTDLGSGGRLAGIFGLAQDPAGNRRLYMGTVKGLYAREPATTIWYKLDGLPYDQIQINNLLIPVSTSNTMFVNTVNGVFRYNLSQTPPGPTRTPTPTLATNTPTPTASSTPTSTPTSTPISTSTPTPTPSGTVTPTPIPTAAPESHPTPYLLTSFNFGPQDRPQGVVVSPNGAEVYVALHGEDHSGRTLAIMGVGPWQIMDTVDLSPAGIDVGTGPNQVALLGESGRVVVTNRQTDDAAVVDVASGQVMARIPAGSQPNGVFVAGKTGYIANFSGNSITTFDPTTFAVKATLTNVGQEPSHMAGDPVTGDVFVTAHGSDEVFWLYEGTILHRYTGIPEPHGVAFDPASRRLYVANRGVHHTVTVIDTLTHTVVGTIDLIKEPFVLAVNPSSGHLFIACGDELLIHSTYDWSAVASYPLPAGAEEGIAFNAASQRVLVTSRDANVLSVYQDAWPPQVIFTSQREGGVDLFRMLADGTRVQRLTRTLPGTTATSEVDAAGSPDSRWIAFSRYDPDLDLYKLWVMNRDGHNAHALTTGTGNDLAPAWSPDGSRLAFTSDRDGDWEIYVMDLAEDMAGDLAGGTVSPN